MSAFVAHHGGVGGAGNEGGAGKRNDRALLRLGAQMAELEALYAHALSTPDVREERRALAELAGAGTRLAELAHAVAGGLEDAGPEGGDGLVRLTGRVAVPAHRAARRRRHDRAAKPRRRTKLERRISRVTTTTDWIIARAGGSPGNGPPHR
ncbi:hypothetical protein ACFY4C_25720 [Actinomadura viridis]|uniref:hypothetical protein n=1 Tax=Actinomadura viridis TaxID=58110 RepID=UPI00367DE2FC